MLAHTFVLFLQCSFIPAIIFQSVPQGSGNRHTVAGTYGVHMQGMVFGMKH